MLAAAPPPKDAVPHPRAWGRLAHRPRPLTERLASRPDLDLVCAERGASKPAEEVRLTGLKLELRLNALRLSRVQSERVAWRVSRMITMDCSSWPLFLLSLVADFGGTSYLRQLIYGSKEP